MNIFNEKGTAFIGLLVSVLAIALVFVGSFYFYNSSEKEGSDLLGENVVDTYKNVQDDVAEINKNTEKKNSELEETILSDFVASDIDVAKWHVLKRENEGFEIKYPQGWYYSVNRGEAKEFGYDMIIGFEQNEKVWDMKPPYTIEFVISSKDVEKNGFSYLKELETENEKRYFIRTGKNSIEANYDVYVDEMIRNIKFY